MKRGQDGQLGLAEAFMAKGLGSNARLEKIGGLVDWSRFEGLLSKVRPGETGRPPYRALAMFKALLLQQWYGLSDPGLEEALGDRLSFRRFCGFALDETTPDETTLCRFRQALIAAGLSDRLLEELNRQLDGRGLMLKQGTMIDATLVAAQARPPAAAADGTAGQSAHDRDANWTRQQGKSHFGYKAHVAMDQGSRLIRRATLTPAKVYESQVADSLIIGDEKAVYADRAYEQKARRRRLKAMGIKDRIMHRSHKHQAALPRWQQRRNRLIAPIRASVEHLFATLKRCYGYRRVRYFRLDRNALHLELLCMALNLRRAAVLLP
jgi:IS5 family transposase